MPASLWDSFFGTGVARAGYSKIRNMGSTLTDRPPRRFPITLQGELLWPVMESAHYFSSSPAGPFTRKPLTVELAGETRRLQTSSGIFSPDGIDKGTAVLLAEVPAPSPTGNLLDIGCGWGPIALTMALRAPHSKVYAVDVNERCITLTNENATALGLTNVVASAPDAVDPGVRFDTIWSNPPIRIGKDELHSLLKLWLPRLAPGGTAWLVVQKNLGSDSLQRWLAAELDDSFAVTRESTSKSFRILKVRKASLLPQ
ncbi:16S rRNA (guanine1207-N2)-methyltransferase [Pseudarthrobacter siccitolerans]|uniref:16S rRNA (Guanine1207-N2)-methyltransferase n=2 Tax=Pseudarthrobacter siccitolerans TaxID=861266 RepID=A0ABU0PRD0_9MICC|nr:16S rRNA (guanine1207-N2)-methyltransferase [Pseudarthrobacter siccitolerans]